MADRNVLDAFAGELEQRAADSRVRYLAADTRDVLKLELWGMRGGFVEASEMVSAAAWNGDDTDNAERLFESLRAAFAERERQSLELAVDEQTAEAYRQEAWGRRRAFLEATEMAALELERVRTKRAAGGQG